MDYINVNFAGRNFKLSSANGVDQVAHEISSGGYEAPLSMLMMSSIIRVEGAFIDVGANTGVYSVMAAIIAPGRPTIAFEPLPSVLHVLEKNIELNDLQDAVEVKDVALSDYVGTATLYVPDPSHGLLETSASLQADFKYHDVNLGAKTIQVNVATLDSFNITTQVGVIKVDIEGHEHAFLEGAKNTILRDRPIIFIEVLQIAQRNNIRRLVREMSYMDFRLRPDLAIHDGGEVLFDPQAWNHALVPVERLQKFQEICNSCGLTLLRSFIPS